MTEPASTLERYFDRWQRLLRLQDWDVRVQVVDSLPRKTADIKIDMDDKKAIVLFNGPNPRKENLEGVVIHELLHLKLYGLDQMLEQLIGAVFGTDEDEPRRAFADTQFMVLLESTIEDLAKAFLTLGGDDKTISFGRVQEQVDKELGRLPD